MTLLIDADWLVYNSCCAAEEDTRWNEHQHTLHSDVRDCIGIFESRLEVFKNIAEDKHDVVMCFTSYPTFRHDLYQEYKAKRKSRRKPLALKAVMDALSTRYKCVR